MAHVSEDNDELSPTSPVEESDTLFVGDLEPEPEPGVNGTPVHCESQFEVMLLINGELTPLYPQGTMCVARIFFGKLQN